MHAPTRITLITGGFLLAGLAVVGRSAQLQIAQGAAWRARADSQQTTRVTLPARRGTLADRNGVVLAVTRETFAVGLAPAELDDPAAAVRAVAAALREPTSAVSRAVRSGRVWVEWPGPYRWDAVEPLRGLRGVYLQRRLERFYPRRELAPGAVGRVGDDGRGLSGLERAFDSVLAGRPGSAVMLRDHRGRTFPSPSRPAEDPVDGADVTLTLDVELQEIADRALAAAVREAGASGGDVVILQPTTGEVLAITSVRGGRPAGGLVGDVFEPGSTAKVFTAASLLRTGRATPHDTVDAENGTWTLGTRTIHDTHPARRISLNDVIRLSSNIGIAKLGQRLTAVEQYEGLRDFGFGTPTGVELPGESPGILRHPRAWSGTSAAALAMGYELSVTPLQLAAAYAVLANGGILVEPTLVRDVRESDGRLRWHGAVRPVRRVVSRLVADQLAHMLRGVVEEGTGAAAALRTYAVAGKTGTARRAFQGGYAENRYTASFVGMFPAVDPQLVLVVKIDDPARDYFGGQTAAPVVRTILEAALATPAVALDRGRLVTRRAPPAVAMAARGPAPRVSLDWPPAPIDTDTSARPVPDVAGLDLRAAARVLHAAGFRARIAGWGHAGGTRPEAGTIVAAGTLVTIRAERGDAR